MADKEFDALAKKVGSLCRRAMSYTEDENDIEYLQSLYSAEVERASAMLGD